MLDHTELNSVKKGGNVEQIGLTSSSISNSCSPPESCSDSLEFSPVSDIVIPDDNTLISNKSEQDCRNMSPSNYEGNLPWAYHEEDGKFFATPKLGKKWENKKVQLTTSVSRRFNTAKALFGENGFPPKIGAVDDSPNKQVRFSSYSETYDIQVEPKVNLDNIYVSTKVDFIKENIENGNDVQKLKSSYLKPVSSPLKKTKNSDLSEPTSILKKNSSFKEVNSTLSSPHLSGKHNNICTISSCCNVVSPDITTNRNFEQEGEKIGASEEQHGIIKWSYRKEDGETTATPHFRKKRGTSSIEPTASPMLRFKAAKVKFSSSSDNSILIKKIPQRKNFNCIPGKRHVSGLINQLNDNTTSNYENILQNRGGILNGVLAPYNSNIPDISSKPPPHPRTKNVTREKENIDGNQNYNRNDNADLSYAKDFSTVHSENSFELDIYSPILEARNETDYVSPMKNCNENYTIPVTNFEAVKPNIRANKKLKFMYPGRLSSEGHDAMIEGMKVDDEVLSIAEVDSSNEEDYFYFNLFKSNNNRKVVNRIV